MNAGLVTVIIPSYNRSHLIRRCFESVLAQSHRPLEVIIADDCSSDNTAAIIEGLPQVEHVELRYVRLAHNQGASVARNAAIKSSHGSVIAFLDSDDVWFSNHLQLLLPALQGDTGIDVAYSRVEVREAPGVDPLLRADFGPTRHEVENLAKTLYLSNSVLPSVAVVTRRLFETVGYFDEDRGLHEDWDFFLRAAEAGARFAHVPHVTGCYTQPKEETPEKQLMMLRRTVCTLEKHRHYCCTPRSQRIFCGSYHRLKLGLFLLKGGSHLAARSVFAEAVLHGWKIPTATMAGIVGILASFQSHCMARQLEYATSLMMRRLRVTYLRLRGGDERSNAQ